MYLSKIWNKSKGPILPLLAIIAPSILGIWNFDFQKLSPDLALSSPAIYSTRVELTIWFLLIVVILMACVLIYSLIVMIKDKNASKAELADAIKSIRETVENNYTIYQRDILSRNIEKAMNEEANKGSSLPQGSLAGRLFDIYLNEVSVYSSMLRECTVSLASQPEMHFSASEFVCLFQEMLIIQNKRIKNFHNRQITNLFTRNSLTLASKMIDHFSDQADVETKLRYKQLLAALNIKNLSSCDEMVFQSWEPVIREQPKSHIFVEEDAVLLIDEKK